MNFCKNLVGLVNLIIYYVQIIFILAACLAPLGLQSPCFTPALFICLFFQPENKFWMSVNAVQAGQSHQTSTSNMLRFLIIFSVSGWSTDCNFPSIRRYLLIFSVLVALSECPHETFVENNICDSCRGWKEVSIS